MKKFLILSFVLTGVVIFSGCAEKKEDVGKNPGVNQETEEKNSPEQSITAGPCKEEKVEIPGYGDPGKKLKNCFVEYPGEPSRQDKSYYIVEDICGQFTKEFVENILGKKLAKIEPSKIPSLHSCSYYLDGKDYLMLNLEYLRIENQKKFYEKAGDKVEKDSNIPMDNLIITHEGFISRIFFILGPEKFISLSPASKSMINNESFLDFASKLGEAIKKYK